MTSGGLVLLVLTAVCTAVANLLIRRGLLRSGQQFSPSLEAFVALLRQPMFVFSLVLVGVASVLWFRILSSDRLTVSYPLLVGLTYVLISVGAMYFFHEDMPFHRVAGLGVILVGMLMLTRS